MDNNCDRYDLPIDIVEQLLCSYCNCYLSTGPVRMLSDGRCICGRCSPPGGEVYARNVLFETAMSKFTFPCRYKPQGCNETFLFGKASEHEDVCPYKTFPCLSLPAGICTENLSVFDIYNHFNEKHLDLITKDGRFKLNLEQNIKSNLMMMVDEIVVIIQCNYDTLKNVLYLNVGHFSHDNERTLCYKTQITSGLDPDRIIHFKELPCYYYQSRRMNEQKVTLLMSNYLPALDNPLFIFINILVTIQNKDPSSNATQTQSAIESPTRAQTFAFVSVRQKKSDKHENIVEQAFDGLEFLRCSVCKYYSIPPVFEGLCKNGKIAVSCSACKTFLRKPREIQYKQLVYPCRWIACPFIGNEINISRHQQDCLFQNRFCPVEHCQKNYFTFNNLREHLSGHGTYCPDPKRVIIKLYCDESTFSFPDTKLYFTLFENKIVTFKCTFLRIDKWELCSIGCEGFVMNFYFEHSHCRIKTETLSKVNNISLQSYNGEVTKMFPSCFKICKRNEAVIEIMKPE